LNKINEFIENRLILPITFITLPVLIFAMIFQTEMFTIVKLTSCIIAALVGAVGAVWIMHYVLSFVDSENLGRRLKPEDIKKLLRSMAVCDVILVTLTFVATNIPAFMIGVGGSFLTFFSLMYHLIWNMRRNKKKNED